MITMDEEQYFVRRLDDQIAWYSKKSQWNQRWYKRLRSVEILAAGLIPFLTGFVPIQGNTTYLKLSVGGLGVLVTVVAGVVTLYRFQELWLRYRTASESLKHEKFLFLTQAAPYGGENPFRLLVRRVESLLSQEHATWGQFMQEEEKGPRPPKA